MRIDIMKKEVISKGLAEIAEPKDPLMTNIIVIEYVKDIEEISEKDAEETIGKLLSLLKVLKNASIKQINIF